MANQYCIVVNPTDTAFEDVNSAGDDVEAYTAGSVDTNANGITVLTDAEQAVLAASAKVGTVLFAVTEDATPTDAQWEALQDAGVLFLQWIGAQTGNGVTTAVLKELEFGFYPGSAAQTR